jgi:fatty acid desaturase
MVATPTPTLTDRDLLRRVNELRRTDNVTNWFVLLREYLLLAAVIAPTVWLYVLIDRGAVAWPWAVPATLAAVVLVGAGQHRLATLTHEAAHYMLFRNRRLNEFVSEWFCMYPLWGTTHDYRVQHLGHHQFPNDPHRDPDVAQMRRSGHRFVFPLSRSRFLWECLVSQIVNPLHALRYVLVRGTYRTDNGPDSPYRMARKPARVLRLFAAAYFLSQISAAVWFVRAGDGFSLAVTQLGLWLAAMAFYRLVPERLFAKYVIQSDLSVRNQVCLRVTHVTGLFVTLAWLTLLTNLPWTGYYLLLWVVPLCTSFAFFMSQRQVLQHGNADEGRLTNTRNFELNRLFRWAVFPIGNDYHLPHHLFPMVPHYNLRALHELLQTVPEYRTQATRVDGYFAAAGPPPEHYSVLDVMTK